MEEVSCKGEPVPPFFFIWNVFLPTWEKIRVMPLFGICEFIWASCFSSFVMLKICLWNKDFCGFVTEMEEYMYLYNYINYLHKFRESVWKTPGFGLNSVQDSTWNLAWDFLLFHCCELIWTSTLRVYTGRGNRCPCMYILGVSGILWGNCILGNKALKWCCF